MSIAALRTPPLTEHGDPLPKRGDPRDYDAPCTLKQYRELSAAGWDFDADDRADQDGAVIFRERGQQWRHSSTDDRRDWCCLEDALRTARYHRKRSYRKVHVTDRLIALRMDAVAHGEHPAYGNASEVYRLHKEIERERRQRFNACPARERAAQSTAVTTEDAVASAVRDVAIADRRERAVRTESA